MDIFYNLKVFIHTIWKLVFSPVFILVTIIGNSLIGLGAFAFYQLEKGINPKMHSFLDALWWSFATATTTGYGDITPMTSSGKILGIALMLIGTAIFALFTGLFAETILSNEKLNR